MTATLEDVEIEIGTKIPKFTAIDQDGDAFTSEDLTGMPFVLYFYPKNGTPGCTEEACDFRDYLEEIEEQGITVVGVSPDTAKSHHEFSEKNELDFTLLSDENLAVCRTFDVVKDENSIERTTFIVDSEGKVQWIERPVKVKGHVKRVMKAIKELGLE